MRIFFGALAFVALAGPALAEESAYQNLLKPLLDTNTTVIGEPLAYPEGKAKVSVAVVTLPPGGSTGWHLHPVPLVAYIISGELSVDYGDRGKRVYKTGQALVEAMTAAHNGTNTGTVPVEILAVYLGADGMPTSVTSAQ